MRKYIFIVLLQPTLICFSQRGPEKVELNQYIGDAKKIAIVQFTGFMDSGHEMSSPYNFKIEQPLKGNFEKTEIFLNHKYGYIQGGLEPGDQCVIFITDGNTHMNNQFEYVDMIGKYQHDKSGQDQIIYIEDFYDSTGTYSHWDMENAYKKMKATTPQSLTEKQMKNYLTKGKYESHVKGWLYFFSEKTQQMEPSKLEIKIDIGFTKQGLTYYVTPSFSVNDFPAQPKLNVFDFGYLGEMIYDENGTRPLEFQYELLTADTSGENIEARFWINSPEELTEKEFLDYLSHPSYGPPYFEFELITSNKSTYKLTRWDELRTFNIELSGFMGQTFSSTGMSPPNPKGGQLEMKYGEDLLLIEFNPRPEKKVGWPFIQDQLVREAKIAPIEANITWKKNGMVKNFGACTIYYKRMGFAINPNYKGK